jgi:hypothetical protein
MAHTSSTNGNQPDPRDRAAWGAAAVHAAQDIAQRHGIAAEQARVLHDANNVVVHLAPSPVVAKICRASVGDHGWRKLATELEIARHLVRAGAPVVGPSQELPPGPHTQGGFAMTFWRHHDHDPSAPASTRAAGQALAQVHEALDSYPETFPSFLDRQVRRASRILFDETAPSTIPVSERAFLCAQYLRISSMVRDTKLECRTLHGDPHRGNFLVSQTGYLLIDFESVCSGPLEWDLSALPGMGAGAFSVDVDLLSLLRRLRSVCVAVWCRTRLRSSTALDRVAGMHIGLLTLAAQTQRA